MKYDWYNESSKLFLTRGYLVDGESIQDRIDAIAKAVGDEFGDKELSLYVKEYHEQGYYVAPSPYLANYATNRGSGISCFNSHFGDSVQDIMTSIAEIGIECKQGGGTSGYYGDIRAEGSKIWTGGYANGPMYYLEMANMTKNKISQNSVRRGEHAAFMNVDNAHINEFLEINTEGNKFQRLPYGVCVPTQWLNDMRNGDIVKQDVWAKLLDARFRTGFPYIMYTDVVNDNTVDVYKDKKMPIKSTNMCVSGDTNILTSKGYTKIKDIVNKNVNVWNGKQFSNVKIVKTGSNQKLLNVNFSNGQTINCTEYHKFYIQEGYNKGKVKIKNASELKPGDRIIKHSLPVIEFKDRFKDAYTQGFFSGDGCTYKGKNHIDLYGVKQDLLKYLVTRIKPEKGIFVKNKLRVYVDNSYTKYEVPSNYTIKSRLDWLAGICDSDGTLLNNKGTQSIQLSSSNKEFLDKILLMLQTLGVNSKITLGRKKGFNSLPDGKGDHKDYFTQDNYRLFIPQSSLVKLVELGFSCKRLKFKKFTDTRESQDYTKVLSILDKNIYEDTFCANEPLEHKLMFNGVLSGNCTEILLPSNSEESFVCDLMGINLAKWDEMVAKGILENVIRVAVYIADAVLTDFIRKNENNPLMTRPVRFAKRHRAIGIGASGYHTLLQSKMIPFESLEAQILNIDIFKTIQNYCYKASEEMASKYGKPEVLAEDKYKRRHTCLTAIAPNTSSSFIMKQQSQSIEPYVSNYYISKKAKVKYVVKNEFLSAILESKGMDTTEVWASILKANGSVQHLDFLNIHEKNVFKTFEEISQYEIITQAAQRQKYIDQGQSLNLMIPATAKLKDVNKLYLTAHDMGIKTLYYQLTTNAAQEFIREITCDSCAG